MKLKSEKLSRLLRNGLLKMGYLEFKDKFRVANCLFIKPIEQDFYLNLGMTISRNYEGRFTADYYLSRVTVWAAMWGDIPASSYKRIGHYLTEAERQKYLDPEFCKAGNQDAWWDVGVPNVVENFLNVVKITENRFLDTPSLFEQVSKSEEIQELYQQSQSVKNVLERRLTDGGDNFLLYDGNSKIQKEWFDVSEMVLRKDDNLINENLINRLAADSWRQTCVKRLLQGDS
jgi:hypothetical protein